MNPYKKDHHTNMSDGGVTALEAKLQVAAAALRRERDEAHRRKRLAEERLRLVEEEAKALESSTDELKKKLVELEFSSGSKALEKIEKLKKDVKDLTDQVEFQHKELIQMREKKKHLIASNEASSCQHQKTLARLQEAVCSRRQSVLAMKAAPLVIDRPPFYLSGELEDDIDGSLYRRWPNIIRSKAEDIKDLAHQLQETSDGFELIIAGYKNKLGLVIETPLEGDDCNLVPTTFPRSNGTSTLTELSIDSAVSELTVTDLGNLDN